MPGSSVVRGPVRWARERNMIQVEVTMVAIAETQEQVDALFERLMQPAKGVTIRVNKATSVRFPNAR
jgi:hypothetical protein